MYLCREATSEEEGKYLVDTYLGGYVFMTGNGIWG